MVNFKTIICSTWLAGMTAACLMSTVSAQVSDTVREYRLNMFAPEVSSLANRTFELMFDTARVETGDDVWELPAETVVLDFSYTVNDADIAASDFAERTYTDGLLIMKDGVIVHEEYLNYANENTHFNSYSMSKTFNSIMAGAAIDAGLIPSVDVPITNYMPELVGSAYEDLTLKHILQMRTGVNWDDNFFAPGPSRDAHVAAFVNNEARYVSFAEKITDRSTEPGTTFNYNSIEAALVGEIVSRAVDMPLADYLSETVWQPAGMQHYGFYALDGVPGVGREFSAGAYSAVLRDYARVAQMMLNGGSANGERILSEEWVKESTAAGPDFDADGQGYAYLWWALEDSEAFFMLGGEGQYVFVDPATDTVIIKLSHIPVGSEEGDRATAETMAFLQAASKWSPR